MAQAWLLSQVTQTLMALTGSVINASSWKEENLNLRGWSKQIRTCHILLQ